MYLQGSKTSTKQFTIRYTSYQHGRGQKVHVDGKFNCTRR